MLCEDCRVFSTQARSGALVRWSTARRYPCALFEARKNAGLGPMLSCPLPGGGGYAQRLPRLHSFPPKYTIENPELLAGDCIALVSFALYKQIAAIVLSPNFPGWLAPLAFNPLRFAEFASFALTLLGSWVASAWISGGYRRQATADLQTVLTTTSVVWLTSMPVAAAQLVLVTAAENQTLVGGPGFAVSLPLAASGPGEPFVTAAGVLGVMAIWRCFYCIYLDFWNFKGDRSNLDFLEDAQRFRDALFMVATMAAVSNAILQTLQLVLDTDQIEAINAM